MLEEILPERLDHPGVPNQIPFEHRHGRKALEKVGLESGRKIVLIAEAFHKLALLRRAKIAGRPLGVRLADVFPHHFAVWQTTRVLRSEPLPPERLPPAARGVVFNGESIGSRTRVLHRNSLRKGPRLRP